MNTKRKMGAARGFIVWSDGPDRDMEGAGGVRSEDGGTFRFSFTPPWDLHFAARGGGPPQWDLHFAARAGGPAPTR